MPVRTLRTTFSQVTASRLASADLMVSSARPPTRARVLWQVTQ